MKLFHSGYNFITEKQEIETGGGGDGGLTIPSHEKCSCILLEKTLPSFKKSRPLPMLASSRYLWTEERPNLIVLI
jgi:hypothetical protein